MVRRNEGSHAEGRRNRRQSSTGGREEGGQVGRRGGMEGDEVEKEKSHLGVLRVLRA